MVIMLRGARARDLTSKAMGYAGFLAKRPGFTRHVMRGVHAGELQKLDARWIRNMAFESIIDIGSNSGQFSSAARAVWPDARIWAMEPLPDVFGRLQARFAEDAGFEGINVAVSDTNGEATFYRSEFSKSSSLNRMAPLHKEAFPWTAGETAVQVPVRMLDEVLDLDRLRRPLLMKIDVQGSEDRVIRGAEKVLALTDCILVEMSTQKLYEGQALFDEVYRLLHEAEFEYRGNREQLLHPDDDRVLQVEAAFTRAAE